jgi:hypothetical protein
VVTKRLRDGAELIRGRPVKLHMATGHQRMECAGGGHAIGKPLPAAATAVGVARPAVTISARAAVVAVDEGYDRRESVADERGGCLDANAGEASLTGGCAHVRRVQSRDLAEALIIGNAVDNQSVDILETKAGIGQRLLQRPQAEVIGIVFRQLAVACVPHADHGHGSWVGHCFPSLESRYHAEHRSCPPALPRERTG